jgi:predicted Na+-dependent transporter
MQYRNGHRSIPPKTTSGKPPVFLLRVSQWSLWGTRVISSRMFPIIAAGVIVHLIYLFINGAVTEGMERANMIEWKERKAVWLLTSQKTLPVAMTILTYLDENDVGNKGLVAIPMIIGHMSQLFIDSYISGVWAERAEVRTSMDCSPSASFVGVCGNV